MDSPLHPRSIQVLGCPLHLFDDISELMHATDQGAPLHLQFYRGPWQSDHMMFIEYLDNRLSRSYDLVWLTPSNSLWTDRMNESGPPAEDAATRIARARRELATLAQRSEARIVATQKDRPCKWWPGTVRSAVLDMPFTEAGAWHFVSECLEAGQELEEVALRKPPGKLGYVMKVRVHPKHELIYIKLQLGAGKVIGRSFHYSQTDNDDD